MSTPVEALDVVSQSPDTLSDEQQQLVEAAELFGATMMISGMAEQLGAQSMRMLQAVRDTRAWEKYGFKSFDDLLDNHPRSPMTKHQFYERQKALGLEGDTAFNALNALRAPISKRKLLKEGDVTVEGDTMTIGDQTLDLNDKDGVLMALSTLAMDRAKDRRTIERGKKELDTKKRRIDELEEKISHGGGIAAEGTTHGRALTFALGELATLNQEIPKIEDESERKRFGDLALERIAQAKLELEETLGYTAPEE